MRTSYTAKGRLAGVIGWPVSHSRSPVLHGHWLARYGIDGTYIALPVAPDDLETVVRALPRMGFAGFNVTIPHKERIMPFLDTVDPVARRIGAVNTVMVGADGTLTGGNTDGYGFIENVRRNRPELAFDGATVAIIGAGGAVRSVVVSLIDAGVKEILIANRSRDKVLAFRDEFPAVTPVEWQDRNDAVASCNLLVNGTSLGMNGMPPLDLSLDAVPDTTVVTDLVYTPLMTDLLTRASRRGLAVVDGLGMLLHQAKPGFEAWFGVTPQVDGALRDAVLNP